MTVFWAAAGPAHEARTISSAGRKRGRVITRGLVEEARL
jgi:hypothetical protein